MTYTIEQLQKAITQAESHPQFAGYYKPIEQQLREWGNDTHKIYWKADVSNGCGQAFVFGTTTLE